jgi:hypothetical protein
MYLKASEIRGLGKPLFEAVKNSQSSRARAAR